MSDTPSDEIPEQWEGMTDPESGSTADETVDDAEPETDAETPAAETDDPEPRRFIDPDTVDQGR